MTSSHETPAEGKTEKSAQYFIQIPLAPKRIADLMTTGIESGDPVTQSWFRRVSVKPEDRKAFRTSDGPWYSNPDFWAQDDFEVLFQVDKATSDDTGQRFIHRNDINKALALLGTVRNGAYADSLSEILNDNEDASTADIFMQMLVYGDEVYA